MSTKKLNTIANRKYNKIIQDCNNIQGCNKVTIAAKHIDNIYKLRDLKRSTSPRELNNISKNLNQLYGRVH